MKIEMSETESDAILYAIHFMEERETELIESYTISILKNIINRVETQQICHVGHPHALVSDAVAGTSYIFYSFFYKGS